GQRPVAFIVGILGLAEFAGLIRSATWSTGARSLAGPVDGPGSNVEKLGRSLFSTYLLAFEVTSALLVIAVVASVVLTRRPRPGAETLEAEIKAEARAERESV
ncbi:MAG TPA: NADH-quinone oxidoreductase subunit J, partial [Acidimicrobiales bacterium]|nr:NADH-quinone oxidoreductase subunit J [Acidimicrobiales bacterium]